MGPHNHRGKPFHEGLIGAYQSDFMFKETLGLNFSPSYSIPRKAQFRNVLGNGSIFMKSLRKTDIVPP